MLWQPLDQCPITAQVVNLTGGISSRNTSCVFTRELDRELQQYSTDYLYKLTLVHAMTVHCPTLMSMPCPHVHYSSTIHLPQGQHAIYMCSDVILYTHLYQTYPKDYVVYISLICHSHAIIILFFQNLLYSFFFYLFFLI